MSILKTLEATAADLKSQMGPVADRMKDTADDLMEKIGTESRHFGEMMGERLAAQGTQLYGGSPEEYRQFIAAEQAKWTDIIRRADIRVE